jgi:hypothetical protein
MAGREVEVTATVLPVVAEATADGRPWVRVMLPGRPNGRTGWIPADRAIRTSNAWRITINLRARRAVAYRNGKAKRSFRAVIGKPSTPTPRAGGWHLSKDYNDAYRHASAVVDPLTDRAHARWDAEQIGGRLRPLRRRLRGLCRMLCELPDRGVCGASPGLQAGVSRGPRHSSRPDALRSRRTSWRTAHVILAAGRAERLNACGAGVRPGLVPAAGSEAGTHRGAA